jgi:hypothetical protein
MGKNKKLRRMAVEKKRLEEQELIPLARQFRQLNIKLLLECFTYDYSWLINEYEEFNREYIIGVRSFKEDIVENISFCDKFEAFQPLVDALEKIGLQDTYKKSFLYRLEDLLDEDDFFTRIQLREALLKAYPEGKIIEERCDFDYNYGMYVVLTGDAVENKENDNEYKR